MSNEINTINNYKRNLITLLTIPLILIGCIYISYGKIFDGIIIQQSGSLKFYQLQVQLSIFQNEFSHVPLKSLPHITATIGLYSVIAVYFLYYVWLLLFTVSSYLHLSQQTGSKISILVELSMILVVYIILISPGLNLWFSIFSYVIIAIIFVMLLLYWVYEIKTK